MLQGFHYAEWLGMARRAKSRDDLTADAEDLVQEAIVVAVRAGRTDFGMEDTRKWFAGVLRNVARQARRSSLRRTAREKLVSFDVKVAATDPDIELHSLGQSNRRLATLVLAGLSRAELQQALGTSDAALRQRMVVLRRALRGEKSDRDDIPERDARPASRSRGHSETPALGAANRDLPTGLIRQALIRAIATLEAEHAVGTHDPDGHPIVLVKRKS